MAVVYLGLGSNVEAESNLRLGIRKLRDRYGEMRLSSVYRNSAVGFDGADFLNLVVGFETADDPAQINELIESIHNLAGRQREDDRFSSRSLDIDLLLYGEEVIDEPPLRLPRSDVLRYSFVLGPLAELAPDYVHPHTGRTLAEHWQECDTGSHPLTLVDVTL